MFKRILNRHAGSLLAYLLIFGSLTWAVLTYSWGSGLSNDNRGLNKRIEALKDSLNQSRKQCEIADNRQFRITSQFREGHDLFVFGRIGDGNPRAYMYVTNLEVSSEFIHKVIIVCDSAKKAGAPVDADFAFETLFMESRFTVPDGLSKTHDSYEWQFNRSTIHHYGWTEEQLQDPLFRLYGFVQYCKDNLHDVQRADWRKCYRLGRSKYFKQ